MAGVCAKNSRRLQSSQCSKAPQSVVNHHRQTEVQKVQSTENSDRGDPAKCLNDFIGIKLRRDFPGAHISQNPNY